MNKYLKYALAIREEPDNPNQRGIVATYEYEVSPVETCSVWVARQVPVELAALFARAPEVEKQRDRLLAACKKAMGSNPFMRGKAQITIDEEAWQMIRAAAIAAEGGAA